MKTLVKQKLTFKWTHYHCSEKNKIETTFQAVWFLILKTVFSSQKQGEEEEHAWLPFFFLKRHKRSTRLENKNSFQICVLKNCYQGHFKKQETFVFSRISLFSLCLKKKKSSQNQEPYIPLVTFFSRKQKKLVTFFSEKKHKRNTRLENKNSF